MNLTKPKVSRLVRLAIVALVVSGSFAVNGERFLLAQSSDLEHRQRQYDRIRGLPVGPRTLIAVRLKSIQYEG